MKEIIKGISKPPLVMGEGLYCTDDTSPLAFPPSLLKKYIARDISLGVCPTVSERLREKTREYQEWICKSWHSRGSY